MRATLLGIKGPIWPPKEQDIVAWSNFFRSKDTYSNYLGYVRTGCMILMVPTDTLRGDHIKRAKLAIVKREQFGAMEKQFVQQPLLVKVMK